MAKKNQNTMETLRAYRTDPTIKRVRRFYGIMGFVFVVFMFINMLTSDNVFTNVSKIYAENKDSLNTINTIWDNLTTINENVLLMATVKEEETNEMTIYEEQIEKAFADIDNLAQKYYAYAEKEESEPLQRRFNHAVYAINNYQSNYETVKLRLLQSDDTDTGEIYQKQLRPYAVAAKEMLDMAIEICEDINEVHEANAQSAHNVAQWILTVLLVVMIISMWFAGTYQIRSIVEVKQQSKELTEASNKVQKEVNRLCNDQYPHRYEKQICT